MPQTKSQAELAAEGALSLLGSSNVFTNTELAERLGMSRDAVRRGCRKLASRGMLRYSKVPRGKPLWRFVLTNDVVHAGILPAIRALRARLKKALRRFPFGSGKLAATFEQIFDQLEEELPNSLAFLARCRRAVFRELRRAESQEAFLERLELVPFRPRVLVWWPVEIEKTYEEPAQQILERVDLRRLRALSEAYDEHHARDVVRLEEALEEPEVALSTILTARIDYEELVDLVEPSGLQELLIHRQEELRKIMALETLPAVDIELVPEHELRRNIEISRRVKPGEIDLGRDLLDELAPELLARMTGAEPPLLEDASAGSGSPRNPGNPGNPESFLARFVSGWRRVGGSARVASANLLLADAEGVAATVPSAGGTSVGAGLAAICSIKAALLAGREALGEARKAGAEEMKRRK